jgi:hypothetical protein
MSIFSKTDIPCDCGYLNRSAQDPNSPIEFDAKLKEFNIIHGQHHWRINHCPFCGGTAPESLRKTLFTHVPHEEARRLFALVEPHKTLSGLIAAIGPYDCDEPIGAASGKYEAAGQAPETTVYRTVTFSAMSEVANLSVSLHPDGRVAARSVSGKYLGSPAPIRLSTQDE